MRSWVPLLLVGICCQASVSQAEDPIAPQGFRPEITVPRMSEAPRIEDFLDMAPPPRLAGTMTRINGGLVQRDPHDGAPASQHTDVYLGYDADTLYVVFVAFDDQPGAIRANLTRREDMWGDDTVELQLDTFLDHRRAFTFLCNPFGVQWDAMWTEGQGFDASFDTLWNSHGQLTEQGYVVVMEIPFKSLRFPPEEIQRWGFFLVRDIPRNNESSFFPPNSNHIEGRLNQEGTLAGLEGISPGRNMQFIPFLSSRSFKVLDDSEPDLERYVEHNAETDVGLDAKFVLKDSMVLDLTVSPDFSQVESDAPQITVNERFEVFFPEKRPFFLENADYFSTPINLLFTRRIADPSFGARLTGKVGKTNLGVLLIDDQAPGKQVDSTDPLAGKSARFGILRVSRDILDQSKIGFTITDRRLGDGDNRVGSLDARIKLNEHWVASAQSAFSHTTWQDGTSSSGHAIDLIANRQGRHFSTHLHVRDYDDDFLTQVGFVRRVGIRDYHGQLKYLFRPEGKYLLSWGPALGFGRLLDPEGLRLERSLSPRIDFNFRRQTSVTVHGSFGREQLRVEDFSALEEAVDFDTDVVGVSLNSRFSNAINLSFGFESGGAINFAPAEGAAPGAADFATTAVGMTLRPLRRLRVELTWLSQALEDSGSDREIFKNDILRTRLSWQFSRKATLRAITQYDTLETDPSLTSRDRAERLNFDLLFSYLANPWTAFYLGYNTNRSNLDFVGDPGHTARVLTDSADFEDAHQIFFKITYLFRI